MVGLVALQNAALHEVTERDAGAAAGLQRCLDQLGGAVGLAALVGVALAATTDVDLAAQVEGYRTAFRYALAGLVVAAAAVGIAGRPPRAGMFERSRLTS